MVGSIPALTEEPHHLSPRHAVARTCQAYHDHRERFLQVWGRGAY